MLFVQEPMWSERIQWVIVSLLLAGFLYLVAAMARLSRSQTRMESQVNVRVTSLETQIRDLQSSLARIEEKLDDVLGRPAPPA